MKRLSRVKLLFIKMGLLPGLIWLVSACGGPPAAVSVVTPAIGEPKVGAPSPQQPGEEIGISIEIASTGGATLSYTWAADGGEIVRGQGSPAITYRVPQEPGTYNIRVKVEWDGQSVEKVTSVKVEGAAAATLEPAANTPEPADTPEPPADTVTPNPTDTPEPANTPKPPTATPTPKATNTPKPTNTPRPTATDTPTPVQWVEGKILFEDNFESGNIAQWSSWGQKWNVVQNDAGNTVLQGEVSNDYAGINAGNSTWENYAFEAKVYVVKFGTADYGETFNFIFRASDDCTQYKWIANEDGLNLLRDKSPNCTLERELRWTDYQLPLKTWITVRVEVTDDIIRGYIDGQEIARVTDELSRLKGGIGFAIGPNCTVWFDDVRVVQLTQQ